MRVVKLKKTDDIADVIRTIKGLKDRDVVFEMEKGSSLLSSSANLKLIKKTGEVMGKKIRVRTDDQMGRVLALKAEVLEESESEELQGTLKSASKVRRSDVKPRFSDIRRPSKIPVAVPVAAKKIKPQPIVEDSIEDEEPTFPEEVDEEIAPVKPVRKSRRSFAKYFVIGMVVLVLAVFALAVLLPTATITIYARSEPITRDLEVTVDKSAQAVDENSLVVPGTVITRDVSQTKTFDATGSKQVGTKASGSVTLYNFTKNTLTLKASTTTLVANGKKFFFTKDVTGLRPTAQIGSGEEMEVDNSTLIPPVAIVAETPGDEYNINANTKFTIVNAALGNQNVYGTNTNPLTGGTSRTVKVVSQKDLDNAVALLTDSVASAAETDLNSENTNADLTILSNGVNKEVLAKTANKNVNDEADSFDMTMIARVSGLAFKNSDVEKIMVDKINAVLSNDKYILPDAKGNLSDTTYKSVDLTKGSGVLSAHYETVVAYKVDTNNLPKLLAGKNPGEIKEILLAKPEIDRVDVEFAPFFVNKAPKLNGKIYIKTMLSQGNQPPTDNSNSAAQ